MGVSTVFLESLAAPKELELRGQITLNSETRRSKQTLEMGWWVLQLKWLRIFVDFHGDSLHFTLLRTMKIAISCVFQTFLSEFPVVKQKSCNVTATKPEGFIISSMIIFHNLMN